MDELAAKRATTMQDGLTDEVRAELRRRYPNAELWELGLGEEGGTLVFRTPPRGEYKRYRTMILDPSQRAMANETLVYACRVYPEAEALTALLERRPALVELIVDKLGKWAGNEVEITEKKF